MKRKKITTIIVALGFLLLFVAASSSVNAFGNETAECGNSGCHDTSGTLTLSSNSTSFSATTGESFILVIEAGNGAEWIKVMSGWEDNAQFTISQEEIEDDSVDDTNVATGEISVELTFTPLSAGTHTIRVWTASADDLASSLDITVTVTGEEITTAPTSSAQPIDLVGTWRWLMIFVPVVTGVILFILGIIMFKGKE